MPTQATVCLSDGIHLHTPWGQVDFLVVGHEMDGVIIQRDEKLAHDELSITADVTTVEIPIDGEFRTRVFRDEKVLSKLTQ